MQESDLLNAGFERLLNAEQQLARRRSLVEASVSRLAIDVPFREAMERLFGPETGVSPTNDPAEIIHTTSALSNNPTMQALLQFSEKNAAGGLEISPSPLKALFSEEVRVLKETVATNTAIDLEIAWRQTDLLAYLRSQQPADVPREMQVQQLQAQKIAAAHASFSVLSRLAGSENSRLAGDMKVVGDSLSNVAKGIGMLLQSGGPNKFGGDSALLSAGLGIVGLFETGPAPDEVILEGIADLRSMMRDFSDHVDYRFDRVDQSLVEIYTKRNLPIVLLLLDQN